MKQNAFWAVISEKHGKLLQVCKTRDEARELKAMRGGKVKGITIIKYVPLAEIR